ncbi:VOC family protein [Pleionea litopenaei]|uniref:Glyoxalase n=1 Tax=Pleionea litopenaei TaxID=3070815 RepID=A0AA51RVA5_9GAMM|nr:VOC family protein [Pleionea sp. HL-JVS1]WMS88401.1 glyoxalase [Pleionea sp. HL-JVS1]
MSQDSANSQSVRPFHLAIPVLNLKESLDFYQRLFPVSLGRRSDHWVDLNLYGHQLVLHQVSNDMAGGLAHNPVDGHSVPVPHFGVILTMSEWRQLADHLTAEKVEFVIEPYIRFAGQPGEQGTLFLLDPSSNALEFKGFNDFSEIFAVG